VGTAWPALSLGEDEQLSVSVGHRQVVVDDWDRGSDVIDEVLALCAMPGVSELNADEKLRDGDGRHRYFVIIVDDLVESGSRPIGVNEECRVEKKSQGRVSIASSSRTVATSREKPGSS
jgi:hypothetical protein